MEYYSIYSASVCDEGVSEREGGVLKSGMSILEIGYISQ